MIRTLLQGRMRHPADARSPATHRALLAQQQVLERAQSPHFTRLPFVPQVQPLTLQAQRATQEDELLARFLAQAVPKKEACARHCAGCRHHEEGESNVAPLTPGLEDGGAQRASLLSTGGKLPPSPTLSFGIRDSDVVTNHSTLPSRDTIPRHSDVTLGPGATSPTPQRQPLARLSDSPSPVAEATAFGLVTSRDESRGGHSLPKDSDWTSLTPNQ